jgi:phosphoglucomutase/phosphomannomutase
MQLLMDRLRTDGPRRMGGLSVVAVRDYLQSEIRGSDGSIKQLDGPVDNLIVMETEIDGNYVAVRPSGTEPKVKMYMFTYVPPAEMVDLEKCKIEMAQRLDAFASDIDSFAKAVTRP